MTADLMTYYKFVDDIPKDHTLLSVLVIAMDNNFTFQSVNEIRTSIAIHVN